MGTLEPEIRDVWAENLDEEMEKIRHLVEKYPYVAMVSGTMQFEYFF